MFHGSEKLARRELGSEPFVSPEGLHVLQVGVAGQARQDRLGRGRPGLLVPGQHRGDARADQVGPGRAESQARIRSVAVLMPNIRRPSRGWRPSDSLGTDRQSSA